MGTDIVIGIIAALLLLILRILDVIDLGKFVMLVFNPNATTAKDTFNMVLSGIPTLVIIGAIVDIIRRVIGDSSSQL